MCTEITTMTNNTTKTTSANNKFTASYSIKKALKAIFKKNKTMKAANSCESLESVESLESIDNMRNAQVEDYATEIEENAANERIMEKFEYDMEYDEDEEEHFVIPVNCVQTPSGTFFWTTTSYNIDADKDLIQPLYCYSENQIAQLQRGDRWAQA